MTDEVCNIACSVASPSVLGCSTGGPFINSTGGPFINKQLHEMPPISRAQPCQRCHVCVVHMICLRSRAMPLSCTYTFEGLCRPMRATKEWSPLRAQLGVIRFTAKRVCRMSPTSSVAAKGRRRGQFGLVFVLMCHCVCSSPWVFASLPARGPPRYIQGGHPADGPDGRRRAAAPGAPHFVHLASL